MNRARALLNEIDVYGGRDLAGLLEIVRQLTEIVDDLETLEKERIDDEA